MALTATEICNRALDDIGSTPITALGDNSQNARVCARQYAAVVEELLAAGQWNWARRRVAPVETTNTRNNGTVAYAAPADMALPLHFLPAPVAQQISIGEYDRRQDLHLPYDLAEGVFYLPFRNVVLEYVVANPDPSVMPAYFVKALRTGLAAEIVYPIKKDGKERDRLRGEAEIWRDRAMANDLNRGNTTYGDFLPDTLAYQIFGDD